MLKTPEQAADAMMRSDEFVQAQHDRPGIAVAAMRARDAEVAAWLDAEAKKYGDRTTSHEEDEAIDGYDAYDSVSSVLADAAARLRGKVAAE